MCMCVGVCRQLYLFTCERGNVAHMYIYMCVVPTFIYLYERCPHIYSYMHSARIWSAYISLHMKDVSPHISPYVWRYMRAKLIYEYVCGHLSYVYGTFHICTYMRACMKIYMKDISPLYVLQTLTLCPLSVYACMFTHIYALYMCIKIACLYFGL